MTESIDDRILEELRTAVGAGNVLIDPEKLADYGHDEFALRDIARVPGVVVLPTTTEQVAEVLRVADVHRIPVTPRGGGRG